MTYKEAIKMQKLNFLVDSGGDTYPEYFEAQKIAIEALEKADKYRWHDLRKNSDDLPKVDGKYRCCFVENHKEVYLDLEFKAEFGFGVITCIEHDELLGCPCEYYFETLDEDEIVLGWQEIEPFEVTE